MAILDICVHNRLVFVLDIILHIRMEPDYPISLQGAPLVRAS